MTARGFLLAVAASFALAAVPAAAHHGWGSYDDARPMSLSGTVKLLTFENPHGVLHLAAADKEWHVVLAPPSRMINRGLEQAMIKLGDTVSVYGYPSRNIPGELRAERITVAGKTTELR
jgi:hypothetical protein